MERMSGFGIREIKRLVPQSYAYRVTPSGDPERIPTGDKGVEGERNDQLISGDFRSRYEHLSRYSEASKNKWGTVIDIGSGTGYGAALLSEMNWVVGIDLSREALRYARSNYPGPETIQGSASSIPLADECADAITAFEVIEHLEEPDKLVEECHRVLKRDGLLFVSSPNPAHIGNMVRKALLQVPIPKKVDLGNLYHLREFTYAEMQGILSAGGFEIMSARGQTLPVDHIVPGADLLLKRLARLLRIEDVYRWLLSDLGGRFPSLSYTVVYIAIRVR